MWLAAAIVALAASVALHAATVRLAPGVNRPLSFLAVGAMVGAIALALVAVRYGPVTIEVAAFAALYAFACELYLFLFSSALTSISMNLLVRLFERPMSDSDIERMYDSRRMVQRRIERLEATGLMRRAGEGGFSVTASGDRLLGLFERLAGFFRNLPHERETGGG